MGLFSQNDILMADCRYIKYGNVIFDRHRIKNRHIILHYLNTLQISSVGRFGEWDYLWSDQSLLSGKKAVDALKIGVAFGYKEQHELS